MENQNHMEDQNYTGDSNYAADVTAGDNKDFNVPQKDSCEPQKDSGEPQSSARRKIVTDFTQGNITSQLLRFAAPLFLSNLFQIVYNMVDMLVVGQKMGSVGLSAVSVGGDVTNFMTFLAMGFSNAGQIIISQYIGAKKDRKLSQFIGTMISFLLCAALCVTAIVFMNRSVVLDWMNAPAESRQAAMDYISVCTLGLVFIYGYNAVSAILRGYGDSRHPFIFISTAAVTNVVLDLLFVMGFGWGAGGAALATVISQTLSFGMAIVFVVRNHDRMGLELTADNFRIRGEYLSILVKLGTPMAIKNAAVSFSKMFVNSWVNSYGVTVSAVSGISNKLATISNLFSNCINTSGASMVGQNIGAKKYERVPRIMVSTFVVALSLNGLMALLLLTFPAQIFGLFTKEAAVLPVAMEYLPVGVLIFLGSAFRAPMNTLINGSGNYRVNFAVAILDGLVNRIGFGLIFGLVCHMGYFGFWMGDAVANFTPFFVGGIYYLTGTWKTRKFVVSEDED